jgi:hypothetical protein
LNLSSTAKFDLKEATDKWKNLETSADYTRLIAGPVSVPYLTPTNYSPITSVAAGTGWMIIPQVTNNAGGILHLTTSKDSQADWTTSEPAGNPYIAVDLSIYDNSGYDSNLLDGQTVIYLPLNVTFEMGKRYHFKLDLGTDITQIRFTAVVEEWVEESQPIDYPTI